MHATAIDELVIDDASQEQHIIASAAMEQPINILVES